MTEVLKPEDPRAHSPDLIYAIYKEAKGLLARDTLKVIERSSLPQR